MKGANQMKDHTKTCAVCGKPDCTIPGLHGVIRDRAAEAYRQSKAK